MSLEKLRYAQSCFESDGFKTGDVILPGLNLHITLKQNQYLRYDGIVSSIPGYIRSLPKELYALLSRVNIHEYKAFNHDFILDGVKGFLIVVEDISPRLNLHNEAHEAATVAYHFGFQHELEQHFASLGSPVHLDLVSTPHEVGVIAGYLQAKHEGYHLAEEYRKQDPEGWNLLQRLHIE